MGKNQVILRVDASTAAALTKLKALGTPLDEIIGKQDRLNKSFSGGKQSVAGFGAEIRKTGQDAIRATAGMAAGLVSIHTVAQLVTQELQTIRQIEGDFAGRQGQLANLFVASQRVAIPGVTPSSLATEAVKRGADPERFATAFGAAASTSGAALDKEQLFDIASTVSTEFPELTAAADQRSMAGVISSLASASGDDPLSIAGKIQGFTKSVPAFDTSGATRSLQPLAQLLGIGDPQQMRDLGISSPEALSVILQRLATVQNRSRDEAGSQSTNAFLSGNLQFLEAARGSNLLDTDSSIIDVFRLQDDNTTPEVKALKEKLLGGGNTTDPDLLAALAEAKADGYTFTAAEEAALTRRAAAQAANVGGDLSVERKSELAIREMLSGDSPEFQDQMARSIENIPTSSDAARAQFLAQQKLLRGDKVTAPAFFNAEIEAANNSIDLLATGATEAETLNETLKSLAQKAARFGGKSVTLEGFSREIDTYARLLTEPTSFSPQQRATNQDRIIVELRGIRDQLIRAGEDAPYERKVELGQVAGIFSRMADKLTVLFANGSDQQGVQQGALQAAEDSKQAFRESLQSGLPTGVPEDKRDELLKLQQRLRRGPVNLPGANGILAPSYQRIFGTTGDAADLASIAQQYASADIRIDVPTSADMARQVAAAASDAFADVGTLKPNSLRGQLQRISGDAQLKAAFERRRRERLNSFIDNKANRDSENDRLETTTFLGLEFQRPRVGPSPLDIGSFADVAVGNGDNRREFRSNVSSASEQLLRDIRDTLHSIDSKATNAPRTPVNRTPPVPHSTTKPMPTRFAPVEANF